MTGLLDSLLNSSVGVVFICFLLSMSCYAVFEAVTRRFQVKGKLYYATLSFLVGDDLAREILEHPVVVSTQREIQWKNAGYLRFGPPRRNVMTSFIAPEVFSSCLLDIIASKGYNMISKVESPNVKIDRVIDILASEIKLGLADSDLQNAAIRVLRSQLVSLNLTEGESTIESVRQIMDDWQIRNDEARNLVLLLMRDMILSKANTLDVILLGVHGCDLPDETRSFLSMQIGRLNIGGGFSLSEEHLVKRFHEMVKVWYQAGLDNMAGFYDRLAQLWIFIIGTLIVVSLNINLISIALALWTNETVRDVLVLEAQHELENQNNADISENNAISSGYLRAQLYAMSLPVGWTEPELHQLGLPTSLAQVRDYSRPVPTRFSAIVGLLITIFASTITAPFWHALIENAVSQVRNFRRIDKRETRDKT